MREVPAKMPPNVTDKEMIAALKRALEFFDELNKGLERRLEELIAENYTLHLALMRERTARYDSACDRDPMLVKINA